MSSQSPDREPRANATSDAIGTDGSRTPSDATSVLRLSTRLKQDSEVVDHVDGVSSVPVVTTGPTGVPALEPLAFATRDGRTAVVSNCSPETAVDLLDTLESESLPTATADAIIEHPSDQDTLPVPDEGPLAVGCRRVLGPCGWVDPTSAADHDFLDDADVGNVERLGLLGRGRGDAATDDPVGDEWATVRETDGKPVVVVNANVTDDRTLADETLLAGAPLTVLDAAVAVADHVNATDVIVYCNEADDRLHERLGEAIASAHDEFAVVPKLVTGPDAFRATEETMALEAMEGADRIEARIQPPGPAEHGLHGRPTVVHTPRTFAQVYHALVGPEAYDSDDADPGTRLVTVTGDVDDPATVELPTDESLAAVTDAVDRQAFKTSVVGGQFGGLTRDLDLPSSAPALRGADLGTEGAVELLDEETCVVAEVGSRASFAEDENCGRCVPCREGSKQLVELLRDVYRGDYDADRLRELARVIRRSSACKFGVSAARPVTTALEEFEPEFRAHANGRCPSDTCEL